MGIKGTKKKKVTLIECCNTLIQQNDYYELMRFVPAVKADGMGT
jgi:hypothetical protein